MKSTQSSFMPVSSTCKMDQKVRKSGSREWSLKVEMSFGLSPDKSTMLKTLRTKVHTWLVATGVSLSTFHTWLYQKQVTSFQQITTSQLGNSCLTTSTTRSSAATNLTVAQSLTSDAQPWTTAMATALVVVMDSVFACLAGRVLIALFSHSCCKKGTSTRKKCMVQHGQAFQSLSLQLQSS